ncbi:Haa1p [Sugiyamaella lignohabitans]|uniref:Haa1p n=1 Tax=Sugiyamaella lignohabitans TaxID=796027 RepID=A0A161HKY0_9ASCO|nr:Haa1p [Sugiyamaella lignohabitans]ANB12568.1 Haa1p [Sugiyamaella lignohabitans]
MVLIDGVKYACERCIRGHRVSTCNHTDVQLIPIKPKGRPTSQCSHCREARKARALHTKCLCGAGSGAGKSHAHAPTCPCNIDPSQCTCLKNKRARSVSTSSRRSSKGTTPPINDNSTTAAAVAIGIRHNDSHVSLASISSMGSSTSAPPLFVPITDSQLSASSLARSAGHNLPQLTTNYDNSPYYSQSSSYASPSPINSNTASFISLAHPLNLASLTSTGDGSRNRSNSLPKGGNRSESSPVGGLVNDYASSQVDSTENFFERAIASHIPQSDSDAYADDEPWLALTATATITANNYSQPSSGSLSMSPQHTGSANSSVAGSVNGNVSHNMANEIPSGDVSSRFPMSQTILDSVEPSQQKVELDKSIAGYLERTSGVIYSGSDTVGINESSMGKNAAVDVNDAAVKKTNTQLWLDILGTTEPDEGFDWPAVSEASVRSVALPSESGLSSTFDDATPQTNAYLYNSFLPRNYEDGGYVDNVERPPSTEVTAQSHQKATATESITGRSLPDMWNYFAE